MHANNLLSLFFFSAIILLPTVTGADENNKANERIEALDRYWAEVSRSVREGDFEGYKATCDDQGILVSVQKKISTPLSVALARWEKDFIATKSGKVKATVDFSFSQRVGDATTAHETGIFLYTTVDANGIKKEEYLHFEALMVKRSDGWKVLMEYQKNLADKEQWDALKKD